MKLVLSRRKVTWFTMAVVVARKRHSIRRFVGKSAIVRKGLQRSFFFSCSRRENSPNPLLPLHPVLAKRDARIDPAAGAREDALHHDARRRHRRHRRRRLLSGGGKPPSPAPRDSRKSLKVRELDWRPTTSQCRLCRSLGNPLRLLIASITTDAVSSSRRHATLLAFNDRPSVTLDSYITIIFSIVLHFIFIFLNYLFNIF